MLKLLTQLTFSLSLIFAAIATSAQGQIVPDSSLETRVQQTDNLAEITGGKQAGTNLFHSFQDFSLKTGNTAFFNNNLEIDNILSRVTGGKISNIDGLIKANGSANLFLLNPTGVIFGENARLDLGGSFYGSTANSVLFDGGGEFSALPGEQPILTINAPIGLNLREVRGDLTSRGNLDSNSNLTLSGHNLILQGRLSATDNLTLTASDRLTARDSLGNPFIAVAGQELTLQGGNIDLNILSDRNSGLFAVGNLILRSDNPINGDAHYYSGGNFRLETFEGDLGNLISLQDPVVRSQGDVSLAGYTGASLHILAGGSVQIDGEINITGADTTGNSLQETLTLSNGQTLAIDGNAKPTLDIRSGVADLEIPQVLENDLDFDTTPNATGSQIAIEGTINNPVGQVFLSNQYRANRALPAGDITVTAIDTSNEFGDGGDVTVDSRRDINIPQGINTSSVINSQLVTTLSLDPTLTEITSGQGGAIALIALEDILTGDLQTNSGINLALITEVDTLDEANLDFAFPQARLRVNGGGKIQLQGNNLSLGKLNSSSTVNLESQAIALDNFALIGGFLELEIANGGNINLEAANNLQAENINSQVNLSDRLTSNSQTTPEGDLSVAEIVLTIASAEIGSGGDIFLEAGDRISSKSLDSSVTVTSIAENTASVMTNNPQIATVETPAEVFSLVDFLVENIQLGSGGTIEIKSDRADLGDINTNIGITSNSTVFAQANADNDTGANSFANSEISFDLTGDRPGRVILNADRLRVGEVNASAFTRAMNNLDSEAISNSDNSFANADNTSSNTINFDSTSDAAAIRLNLRSPDVDLVISALPEIANNFRLQAIDACPTNLDKLNQTPQAIETAKGKIYPARGIEVKDGKIRLIAHPKSGNNPRQLFGDRC